MTRRDLLAASVVAVLLVRVRPGFAKASQPATAVNFDIPPHACDSHTHIYLLAGLRRDRSLRRSREVA
jgi:hypothetical protein